MVALFEGSGRTYRGAGRLLGTTGAGGRPLWGVLTWLVPSVGKPPKSTLGPPPVPFTMIQSLLVNTPALSPLRSPIRQGSSPSFAWLRSSWWSVPFGSSRRTSLVFGIAAQPFGHSPATVGLRGEGHIARYERGASLASTEGASVPPEAHGHLQRSEGGGRARPYGLALGDPERIRTSDPQIRNLIDTRHEVKSDKAP